MEEAKKPSRVSRRKSMERMKAFGSSADLLAIGKEIGWAQSTAAQQQALLASARAENESLAGELARMRLHNLQMLARAEKRRKESARATAHMALAALHLWKALTTVLRDLAIFSWSALGRCCQDLIERIHVLQRAQLCISQLRSWVSRCYQGDSMSPSPALGQMSRRVRPGGTSGSTPKSDAEKRLAERRAATYVSEDKWDLPNTHGVWFPVHPRKQSWDFFILILIVYSCVVVPFRIGLNADAVGLVWWLELCVTLSFCADLCVNFNTAYLSGAHWVVDHSMIASNYLRTWFVVDALSSFPVELVEVVEIALAHPHLGGDGNYVDEDDNYMHVLRALRMVRLLRMLKLLNIQRCFGAPEPIPSPPRVPSPSCPECRPTDLRLTSDYPQVHRRARGRVGRVHAAATHPADGGGPALSHAPSRLLLVLRGHHGRAREDVALRVCANRSPSESF